MAALVLGEFARVRWRTVDAVLEQALDRPGLTAREADALMVGAESVWGALAAQEVRLCGQHLRARFVHAARLATLQEIEAKLQRAHEAAVEAWPLNSSDDESSWEKYPERCDQLRLLTAVEREVFEAEEGWNDPVKLVLKLPEKPAAKDWTGPGAGQWLICIEVASHCWAALRHVGHVLADGVHFDWTLVGLPGAERLSLGCPIYKGKSFELIYPPPPELERQAALGPGGKMPTSPFQPCKGGANLDVSPLYRYGLLRDGAMRWLDLPPGPQTHPARPASETFRAKLAELKAALARRGVFYMDAPDEKYHHRHSFEDALESVPASFGEDDPPVAYSVSGKLDNMNKEERAEALFNPDRDDDVLHDDRIGFRTLPSEIDIVETGIIYVGGYVGGIKRTQRWTGWTIAAAANEVGLRTFGGGQPNRQIDVFMPDANKI